VRGGLVGRTPSLTDLENGNLKISTDFRQVYAAILQQWLGVDPKAVLGGEYNKLPLPRHADYPHCALITGRCRTCTSPIRPALG